MWKRVRESGEQLLYTLERRVISVQTPLCDVRYVTCSTWRVARMELT
jgi:hypothetical protein